MRTMDRLKISAFRAWDDPQRSRTFVAEHAQVLRDIGVLEALPQNTSWCDDEDCIVVVAEHPELGMVSGCRIQLASQDAQLPILSSLAPLVPDVEAKLDHLLGSRTAELCGLWVAHRFARQGVPWLVTAAAVAVLNQLEVETIFCLSAEYSSPYVIRNGFKIQVHVGSNGAIEFPIPGIRSYALALTDPIQLGSANLAERQRLISLRITPSQLRQEWLKARPFEVYYDLQLRQRVIPLTPPGADPSRAERKSA